MTRDKALARGKEFPYVSRMITSRITSKAQTTIPRAIRVALGLRDGDRIAYAVTGTHVVLSRADAIDDPFVAFDEWAGEEDAKAYAEL